MGVYRQRPLFMALVVIFLLTTFTYYTGYTIQPADTFEPIERPQVPVKTSDLAVTLHQVRREPPTLQVIVENKHPHSFITILLWDSPLDFLALPLGLFEVKPAGSDKIMPMNKTDIKRKYPPKWDLLLPMRPGDRRAQDVVLDPPFFPLEELRARGKTATIQIKGRWKAVWKGTVDDITEESLRSIEVNRGGMMGRFESDELEIDLWEPEVREPVENEWQEEPPQQNPPPPEGSPPEGPPLEEEEPYEEELTPEDEIMEEEVLDEERPPEDEDEDPEDIGRVYGEPEPDEKEKDDVENKDDRQEDQEGSKETSKDGVKNKSEDEEKNDTKDEIKDETKDDAKDDAKDGAKDDEKDNDRGSKKGDDKQSDEDDEKTSKDSKKGGKGNDDRKGGKGKDDKKGAKGGKTKGKGDEKDDAKEDLKADRKKPAPPEPGRDDDHPDKDSHDDESRKDDEKKRVVQ